MQLRPIKNRVLLRFASLKTGIILMVAVAAASMVGTAFPYEKSLALVFYSWWFQLLLLALAANLSLCTYHTLAARVLPALRPRIPKSPQFYDQAPLRLSMDTSRAPEEIESILLDRGYAVCRDGEYLSARKGLSRLFAAPATHVGVMLVLLAGFASGFLAFEGQVRLKEGESTTTMHVRGENPSARPLGFEVTCLDFETATFPQTEIPSRFVSTLAIRDGDRRLVESVEVNKALKHRGLKFHQSGFGEVPGEVRYRVRVTDVASSRSAVASAVLGQPTSLGNWDRDVLLQQSLGGLRYHVLAAEERVATGTLGRGDSALQVRAARFVSDFVIGPDRQVISRSEKMNNPALQVAWLQDGTTVSRQWLFLRPEFRQFSHEKSEMPRLELEVVEPRSDGQFQFHLAVRESSSNTPLGELTLALGDTVRLGDSDDSTARNETQATTATIAKTAAPYEVVLLGTEPLFYTDLTVSYNPMIPVIYFGSVLAIAGICFALYGRRTTLSVWCRESDGRVQVAVQYWPSRSTLTLGVARTLEVLK